MNTSKLPFLTAFQPLWQNKKTSTFCRFIAALAKKKIAIFRLFSACLKNQHSARETKSTAI
ncbi:hypothetical protein [Candidatus Proelusimicrobium excrementi]|uniref:hypothetical protein n=1 Tax=Candidatus Proelusimicrobium excrementi TaxID=3416222 RepID=UPI003CC08B3B|nr:hypothetical protein [Elusimicrobiaceae bacterium]